LDFFFPATNLILFFFFFFFLAFSDFTTSKTDQWFTFPREREGRIYNVNWSLNADGVTPAGENAFRNARLPLLYQRLGVKADTESIEIKTKLHDNVTILEAGDTISQADFKEALDETCEHLSSGMDIFVEDVILGSHQEHQMGVRIITEDPAMALIARTAFVSISLP
jgi:hypothetical protein